MAPDQLLVFATSDSPQRPAYRRDFLNCLCYPEGFPVRFTYRKRRIEERILASHKQWHGRPGLIVFCDIPDDPQQDFQFLPVRHVTFQEFERPEILERADGNTYLAVRFVLGRFVRLAPPNLDGKVRVWQNWVLAQADKYPRPIGHRDEAKARWAFIGDDFREVFDPNVSEETNWEKLSEHLSSMKTLPGCSFFRVLRLRESTVDGRTLVLNEFHDRKTYFLESGKDYRVDVQLYLDPTKASPPRLVPRASAEAISISQPLFDNIGLSTNATILLSCGRVYSQQVLTLTLEDLEPKEPPLMARSEFLVVLRPLRWVLPVVVLLLAIGSLLTGVTPDMIKDMAGENQWIKTHASLLAGVTKAVASFLVGLGGYLGFKKIPGGG